MFFKMIGFAILAISTDFAVGRPDGIKFGSSEENVNTRLGLLGPGLGLNALGEQSSSSSSSGSSSSAFTDGRDTTGSNELVGRVPSAPSSVPNVAPQPSGAQLASSGVPQCCCVPANQQCVQEELDLIGSGLIDARDSTRVKRQITTRIVNIAPTQEEQTLCPVGYKSCCYDSSVDVSNFARNGCLAPTTNTNSLEAWQQIGNENFGLPTPEGKLCGERSFTLGTGLQHGEASVGEFPWTCLLLNQNNDFIGSCVVIPDNSNNDNSRATRKILTAAHKLKALEERDLLKVRVGEYDASGFNAPESFKHEEYTVTRILKHPQMSNTRLSNDIALLYVDKDINLNHPYVNTACLPASKEQFSYTFANGTGTRCWVAGWGKDDFNGNFQFLQKKVDLPLVEKNECEQKLRVALNNQQAGTGDRFFVHNSEVCAGGQVGKDACTGDGGSPLVCQAESGRWSVVGLVAWGVGCASEIPGVYVNIASFLDWIDFN